MTTYGRTIPEADIRVQRGNEEAINLAFTESSAPLDLTGKALRFVAERLPLRISISTGSSGFAYVSEEGGTATLTLSETVTRSLPAGVAVPYEIENYTDQVTLLKGNIYGVGGVNDD